MLQNAPIKRPHQLLYISSPFFQLKSKRYNIHYANKICPARQEMLVARIRTQGVFRTEPTKISADMMSQGYNLTVSSIIDIELDELWMQEAQDAEDHTLPRSKMGRLEKLEHETHTLAS